MTMDDLNFLECILIPSYYHLINPDFFQRQGDTKKFPRNAFMGCLNAFIFDALLFRHPPPPCIPSHRKNIAIRSNGNVTISTENLLPCPLRASERLWEQKQCHPGHQTSVRCCRLESTQRGTPKNGALVGHTENCRNLYRFYQEI